MIGDADEISAMPKLGLRFWVLWCAAFLLISVGFVAGLLFLIKNGLWSNWVGIAVSLTFGVGVFTLSVTPYFMMHKRGLAPKMREPHRRYTMRFLPAMFAYVLILTPAVTFFQDAKPGGVLAWLVAIAPAVPLLFAIRAILLYYKEEDDEFLKAMATQSHLLATGFMMAIATAYGFLDLFGLVPHVQTWAVFPVWALCLFPAQAITHRKFR
ncbi:MAG TPA: hypothetical protein VGO52_20545 [Hyphomonadaceae bacterium]|jgi:hypothetical protein|nr:hypothetical protein [Hyphomonadaceae bacterium]